MPVFQRTTEVWEVLLDETPPRWRPFETSGPGVPQYGHGAAYDEKLHRMLLVGQRGDGFITVWVLWFSDTTWEELTIDGRPPDSRRTGFSVVHDPDRDQLVLLGGEFWSGASDVWVLSLSGTPTWTRIPNSVESLADRYHQSAIYDACRDRIVIVGGVDGCFFNETWAFSLTSYAWPQLALAGPLPAGRYAHAAAYDPIADRMIVAGGDANSPDTYKVDSWALAWGYVPPVPAAPANLVATRPERQLSATLTWQDLSGDERGFEIQI